MNADSTTEQRLTHDQSSTCLLIPSFNVSRAVIFWSRGSYSTTHINVDMECAPSPNDHSEKGCDVFVRTSCLLFQLAVANL